MAPGLILSALMAHAAPARSEAPTVDAFHQRGGPSLSQAWRGADYVAASKALLPARRGDLPRFDDASAGAIFRHMTDRQNLAFYQDAAVPVKARFDDFVTFNQGWGGILQAYGRESDSRAASDPELSQAMVFTLQATAAEMDLLGEYWPQLGEQVSASRVATDKSLIYSGLTHVLQGAAGVLATPKPGMSHTELLGVLEALSETFPHVKTVLSIESLAVFRQRLESARASFPEPDAQARFDAMEAQLDAKP